MLASMTLIVGPVVSGSKDNVCGREELNERECA